MHKNSTTTNIFVHGTDFGTSRRTCEIEAKGDIVQLQAALSK
jgi:hypothetical protein